MLCKQCGEEIETVSYENAWTGRCQDCLTDAA